VAHQWAPQETGDSVTEQAQRPVGSVAEEAARLLDALLSGEGMGDVPPQRAAAPGEPSPAAPGEPSPGAPGEVPTAAGASGTASPGQDSSCGHRSGAEDQPVCHLCPVCQLIRTVRAVNPETVDRLADLAAAVSQTLRDVAANRWAQTGHPAPGRRGSVVEDIAVREDDDEDDDADENDADENDADENDAEGLPT